MSAVIVRQILIELQDTTVLYIIELGASVLLPLATKHGLAPELFAYINIKYNVTIDMSVPN